MAGAVIIVLVMVLLGPIALFMAGGVWSAAVGNQLSALPAPPTPQRD